jgi:hypothetical protein
MFGDCALRSSILLEKKAAEGKPVEMENFFSRFALDIIGKAVFNYEFDSLTTDDPVIQARAGWLGKMLEVLWNRGEIQGRSSAKLEEWGCSQIQGVSVGCLFLSNLEGCPNPAQPRAYESLLLHSQVDSEHDAKQLMGAPL